MNKLRFLFLPLALIALSVAFTSCGGDDDEVPANEITDAAGVDVTLEWSTGGSTAQSIADVDLDLYLMNGANLTDASSSTTAFEAVELINSATNATYDVDVSYFEGNKAVNYTIYIKGKNSPDRVLEYTGSFTATDQDATATVVKITKNGTKYTMAQ